MLNGKVLALVCSLFFLSLPLSMAGTVGEISGIVTDSQGVQLPHIKLQLIRSDKNTSQNPQKAESSDTGEFRFFSVEAGYYNIRVESPEYDAQSAEVHVVSGGTTPVDLQVASKTPNSSDMVLNVKSKRRLIQNSSSVSSSEVSQEEIKFLAQGTEASLPKLITSTTPGVVQGSFGQMFFRGNHGSIQYQIDGVQLPESPSNTFGQTLSPRNIDHMEIITGGIPAEYGQRVSAVINMITRSGTETPGGELELNYGTYNTFSPHLLYGGSNESGDLHYFFSLNYNRTDRGIDTPQPENTSPNGQLQGGNDPTHDMAYGNSQFGRVDWQLDNSNKLTFTLSHTYNFYQIPNYPGRFSLTDDYFSKEEYTDVFGNHEHDQTTFRYVPPNTDDTQSERNFFIQSVWKHTLSERSFFQLAPYYKFSQIVVTNDSTNDLYTAPGGTSPIASAKPTSFKMDRVTNNLGLKADYTYRANDQHLIKTGFQLQASRTEGAWSIQRSLDGSISTLSNNDPTNGYFESVYVQDEFSITKRLTLNAGLRFDATQFVFADIAPVDSMLQPRIGLSYMLTDTTKFHIFYGKLFNPAPTENLRVAFNAANNSGNVGAYDIKAEKSDYFEAGVAQQFFDKQVVALNAYYKVGENFLDSAQLLNTSIAQPFNLAQGYSYGVELSVKGKIHEDWSEFFNYSYNIAQGQGVSGGIWAAHVHGDGYQFLDHAQIHTANAGVTFSKNFFWWTTQGVFGSGLRTGHQKEIALPSHFTFDTTVGYEFHGKSWLSQFKLSADVINIFDNRYPITIANTYNGNHYAAGRQFYLRLTKLF